MTNLPDHNPRAELEPETAALDDETIVQILAGYKTEADNARKSGQNARDTVWRENWDRYWNRYDHSKKADWQSRHVMPEVPQFVDRWAAAMREALDAGTEFFTVVDEAGTSNALIPEVTRVMNVLLARAGTTPDGHETDFSSIFEDQMKMGAIMALCGSVTWKEDALGGRVAVDTVDPREYWRDPKRRNMYRVRQYEIDLHELRALANITDEQGEPLYRKEIIDRLASEVDETRRSELERSSGSGEGNAETSRKPIVIEEWLCTLLSPDGEIVADNALIVVANKKFVIRGPEQNPFWHGQDWIVFTPMISVPLSVYGRTYMEDWSQVADAFIEMTNLILDGAFMSAIKSFVGDSSALRDPRQLDEGIAPGTYFDVEDGRAPNSVLQQLDLGTIPGAVITVWQALKQELREGAKLSEIALGQVPPKGRITATEISQVSQSGSAMIRSIARTIESRWLEPVLTLVWQTALQHMDFTELATEIGEDTANMLNGRREEFLTRKIRFRVRGISGLIDRQTKLQNMLGMLQIVGQSEPLLQALLADISIERLVDLLMTLFGVDAKSIKLTDLERIARQQQQAAQAQQQAQQPGAPNGP